MKAALGQEKDLTTPLFHCLVTAVYLSPNQRSLRFDIDNGGMVITTCNNPRAYIETVEGASQLLGGARIIAVTSFSLPDNEDYALRILANRGGVCTIKLSGSGGLTWTTAIPGLLWSTVSCGIEVEKGWRMLQ